MMTRFYSKHSLRFLSLMASRKLAFTLLTFLSINGQAQHVINITETETLNNPASFHGSSSIVDSSGNLYLLSNSLVGNSTDISLSKIGSNGNTLWVDTLDGNNLNDYGVHLSFNADGDIIICGAIGHATQGYNILVAQYDTSGSVDWTYEYDGSDHLDDIPTFILSDENSNVYVVAGTNTNS